MPVDPLDLIFGSSSPTATEDAPAPGSQPTTQAAPQWSRTPAPGLEGLAPAIQTADERPTTQNVPGLSPSVKPRLENLPLATADQPSNKMTDPLDLILGQSKPQQPAADETQAVLPPAPQQPVQPQQPEPQSSEPQVFNDSAAIAGGASAAPIQQQQQPQGVEADLAEVNRLQEREKTLTPEQRQQDMDEYKNELAAQHWAAVQKRVGQFDQGAGSTLPEASTVAKRFERMPGGSVPIIRSTYQALASAGLSLESAGSRFLGTVLNSQDFKDDADILNHMMDRGEKASALTDEGQSDLSKWALQRYRGVGTALAQTGATFGLATPVLFAGDAYNKALTRADDAGVTGPNKFAYAGGEAFVAGVTGAVVQKLGFGGAGGAVESETTKAGLLTALSGVLKSSAKEIPTLASMQLLATVNQKLSGVDPNAKIDPVAILRDSAADSLLLGTFGALQHKASDLVQNNPEAAQELAGKDVPSRTDWKRAGLTGQASAAERAQLSKLVRDGLVSLDSVDSSQEPDNPATADNRGRGISANDYADNFKTVDADEIPASVQKPDELNARVSTLQQMSDRAPGPNRDARRAELAGGLSVEDPRLEKVRSLGEDGSRPTKQQVADSLGVDRETARDLIKSAYSNAPELKTTDMTREQLADEAGVDKPGGMARSTLEQKVERVRDNDTTSYPEQTEKLQPGSAKDNGQTLEEMFEKEQQGALQKRLAGDKSVHVVNQHPVTELTEGKKANQRFVELGIEHYDPSRPLVYAEGDIRNLGGLNGELGQTGADAHMKAMIDIVRSHLPKGVDMALTSKGGDELGFTFRGIPKAQVDAALSAAQPELNSYIKAKGLDTIEHTKHPGEFGTGINFASAEYNPKIHKGGIFADKKGNPITLNAAGDLIRHADLKLEEVKKEGRNVNAEPNGQAGIIRGSARSAVGRDQAAAPALRADDNPSGQPSGSAEPDSRGQQAASGSEPANAGARQAVQPDVARAVQPGQGNPAESQHGAASPPEGQPAATPPESVTKNDLQQLNISEVKRRLADDFGIRSKALTRANAINEYLKAQREALGLDSGNMAGVIPTPITGADVSHVAKIVGDMADVIHRVFAPASVDQNSKTTAGIVRENAAEFAQKTERAAEALKDFGKAMGKIPVADRFQFIDAMESGAKQPTPELQKGADALRNLLDTTRDQVRALGTGKLQNFIDNYFPHLWKDTAQSKGILEQIGGKRPLQGPAGFLKKRTIPTLADGIAAGLEPVDTNPVNLSLLKVREMNRYIFAQKILGEMKNSGLVKFVEATAKPPDGHTKIDDRVFTEYVPPNSKGGISIHGYWYAPDAAARIVNNYLSPGLRGNPIYDSYQWLGNVMNQAQLGLSAFHLGFTSVDSAVSKAALGVKQFVEGRPLEAAASLARVPIAPIENYIRGSKVLSEYLKPGTSGGETARIVDSLVAGGGRAKMDSFYKNSSVESFWKAMDEGRTGGALANAVPALLEQASKPIMEHLVPRMKLGIFADMARSELSKLPPGATREQIRDVMGKAWDSTDNRMGQLVYDNLFWNKTLKDSLMATVRSVGWNLGTVRELGGGVVDLAKMPKDLATGNKPEFTNRAAYAIALPFTVGVAGAMFQYMMTGKGPDDLKDMFFPRTGKNNPDGTAERMVLPSYMKDVFSYTRHPVDTLKAKLHPAIGDIADMLSNKDFYGNEIRNPNDPLVTQLQQIADHMGKSFIPFSIRNAQEAQKRGQPIDRQALSFFGITPAKKEDTRTPAQNLMSTFAAAHAPSGGKTPEEAAAAQSKRDLIDQAKQSGDPKAAIKNAVENNQLSGKDAKSALKKADGNPLLDNFKALTVDQARQVWAAANDQERAQLKVPYQQKQLNDELTNLKDKSQITKLSSDEQKRFRELNGAHARIGQIERSLRQGVGNKQTGPKAIEQLLDTVSPAK